MGRLDIIARNGYRTWWRLLSKTSTLTITYPKPGTIQANPLYGTVASGGIESIVFAGCVGGWNADYINEDGYRQKDDRTGKVVLMCDVFSIDTESGPQPVSFTLIREITAKPQSKAIFNGDAVHITSVEDDPMAGSVVVLFAKIA